jgi:hypothetical protein
MPEQGGIGTNRESASRWQEREIDDQGHQPGALEAEVEKARGEIGGRG